MDLQNMTANCGDKKPPGTEVELYYVCSCEMNTFPQTEYQLNGTTELGDRLLLAEAFDFSTADSGEGYWRKTPIRVDTGGRSMALLGESTLQGKVRFTIEGTEVEEAGFTEQMVRANGCLILGIRQVGSPHMTIIGTKARPGKITALDFNGGDGPETENGASYEVSANAPLHYYPDAAFGMDIIPNP